MTQLPSIRELKRICKALATLDLIICREWEDRYYSYDSVWAPGEEMASMRDGSGNGWFLLFDASGQAGLKGCAHEAPASNIEGFPERLQQAVPNSLSEFAGEPAFDWGSTTFCYWCLGDGHPWQQLGEQESVVTGADDLLRVLVSPVEAYCQFASEYYEIDLKEAYVKHIFAHQPINSELVSALNPEVSLEDIQEDLDQVGYV